MTPPPASTSSARKVAFITGASRGIGKACAIRLAEAGFDIALSARTVNPGEEREHSSTVKASNTKPLPGSLSETAALVESTGREALLVPADLLDPASLGAAATTVLERWGRVDVLLQNGRYIGPGHMDRFLDTPIELIEKQVQANAIAPLVLAKHILPAMLAQGGGTIIDVTSASGYCDPVKPAGEGGWGLGYGFSKGAFHRVAGILAVEHAGDGIRVFNLHPGFVSTERMAADMAQFGFDDTGAPPDVVAAVAVWLATDDEAAAFNGQNIEAQFFCHERGLLPGWDGPTPNTNELVYDHSGANLADFERRLLESRG